jgi:flagellar M-ring protein FliF
VNDFLRQLLDQTRAAWQRFNAAQRVIVVAVPLLLVFGLGYLLVSGTQPRYRTLYANLSAKDAGTLVEKLKEGGVPYRIGQDGKALEVPEDKLYETRLNLASQNLPLGGGVGFEVFDKNSFGVTDFTQQVNFQRALEGELSRTISHLAEVAQARVHLVMPKPELYSAREKSATASIVIDLKGNEQLKAEQVRGIVYLVAASVEGLDPKNVTLLDSRGNVLSDQIRDDLVDEALGTNGAAAGGPVTGNRLIKQTNGQLEVQRRFEHELERRVSGMLDRVLGPNRAAVRVSAELKWDQVEEASESYEPVANNQGIVRSSQRKTESFNGTGTLPGGVPGTESNIPGYQNSVSGQLAGNSSYGKNEETVNYEINKKVSKVTEAPGGVKRLSVAVMVDSLQPQQVDSIQAAVVAAAGLDLARGDQVAVENVSFDTSERHAAELADLQARRTELWLILWKGLVVLLIVIFLLLFLRSILKPRVVRVQERLIREITRVGESEAVPTEEAAIPLDQVGRPSELALEEQRKAQLRQQVAKLAREKPQAIAMLIRRWLSEEKA